MRALKIYLYKRQIKKRNSFICLFFSFPSSFHSFSNFSFSFILSCAFASRSLSLKNLQIRKKILWSSLSIRKDSFRKLRVVRGFRSRYVHIRLRNNSRQVWAAILLLNYFELKINSFSAVSLFRAHIIS